MSQQQVRRVVELCQTRKGRLGGAAQTGRSALLEQCYLEILSAAMRLRPHFFVCLGVPEIVPEVRQNRS